MKEDITPEEAQEILLQAVEPVSQTVEVPLEKALNRVCAEPVISDIDNPPFDKSPLDGYTLHSEATKTASKENPVKLDVAGVFYAGGVWSKKTLQTQAVRIMTGAMIPQDCDCVIRQEDVMRQSENGRETIVITQPLAHFENYIHKGDDVKKGSLLFNEGCELGPAHLSLLASLGRTKVLIKRPIVIGVLCTGDELHPAGSPLPAGKIYNSNRILIQARLKELGFDVHILDTAVDDAKSVAALIQTEMSNIDVLISTGGVSVGDKDIFHEVLPLLGAYKLFRHLECRPGGAILCGVYNNKPLICLSGNPFAALIGFELIARPALAKISARSSVMPKLMQAKLASDIDEKNIRRFVRANLKKDIATPAADNFSGRLFALINCNCLLDLPAVMPFKAGDIVNCILF